MRHALCSFIIILLSACTGATPQDSSVASPAGIYSGTFAGDSVVGAIADDGSGLLYAADSGAVYALDGAGNYTRTTAAFPAPPQTVGTSDISGLVANTALYGSPADLPGLAGTYSGSWLFQDGQCNSTAPSNGTVTISVTSDGAASGSANSTGIDGSFAVIDAAHAVYRFDGAINTGLTNCGYKDIHGVAYLDGTSLVLITLPLVSNYFAAGTLTRQ